MPGTDKPILLVEDNPNDEELTLIAFKQSRLRNDIVVARDGQEALDYLFGEGKFVGRDAAIQPQLILLDLKLPKIDGLEVLKRIRADHRTRRVPVVVLTASSVEGERLASYNLGSNSYIKKPVGTDEFIEAVERLGLYWLLLNKVPTI